MPRGRHRHSPPLHRLLAPATVAGAALACAGAAWLVGEPGFGDADTVVLRGCAAAAAVTAAGGAMLLRLWDRAAGRRVGELKAWQVTTEWRVEEKHAELEGQLDEAQEARDRFQGKLRQSRAELARLRNEHAALLRRYAHAEAERASALEGRRQLQIEAGGQAKALTTGVADHRRPSGAPTPLTYLQANEALKNLSRNVAREREREEQRRLQLQEERARQERERERRRRPGDGAGGGFDFFGAAAGGSGAETPKRRSRKAAEEASAAPEAPEALDSPEVPVASGTGEEARDGEQRETAGPRHASRPPEPRTAQDDASESSADSDSASAASEPEPEPGPADRSAAQRPAAKQSATKQSATKESAAKQATPRQQAAAKRTTGKQAGGSQGGKPKTKPKPKGSGDAGLRSTG